MKPLIQPLGDRGMVVRFGTALDDGANSRAISLARRVEAAAIEGVDAATPGLVSVFIAYDPHHIGFARLAGEIRILANGPDGADTASRAHDLPVRYGGLDGPDLGPVADALGLSPEAFIAAHRNDTLRVLAIGFAPGFAYCGFHRENLAIPRRREVRQTVPAGSILFAARQTAIAATEIPTGWHVIGRTETPTLMLAPDAAHCLLKAGDAVRFHEARP
ncbi:sensor histidine kinase inhibitor, KipI family [Devosia enhydra]|uniref:Sensor histidine kinase inhibitor, KipI family n=1 Tax=Devosia enhydra TaxID=665118 RepID=A0A1K2HVW6_9HYPH|nr:allophanate hydrolase subunit 1 [Devosia enhydra]SFZ82027.1 sensor histidine kinase inhibitor, KipI family [Devosia enhydra]